MLNCRRVQLQGSKPVLPIITSSGFRAGDDDSACGFGFGVVSPTQEVRVQRGHCKAKNFSLGIPGCTGKVVGTPDPLSEQMERDRVQVEGLP